MSRDAPPEITALAEARSAARAAGQFEEADRLRGQIEAAGWKVVDQGLRFRLTSAHPPDVEEDGRVRYGSSASVPSRLHEPATGVATVVLRATEWSADAERAVSALRREAPQGTRVVVVADAPSADSAARLGALDPDAAEVIWTVARLGQAAALNAGIRRASAAVVILMDASVEPVGDCVSPLVAALEDPDVAVAGGFGLRSRDLRTFAEAPSGDVDAIEGSVMAFRRHDYVARGPLDERFRVSRHLDLWWSLVLRDGGEDRPARRAVAVELPVKRHEQRSSSELPDAERERLSKRNFYRLMDRFGRRRELLLNAAPPGERAGATRRG